MLIVSYLFLVSFIWKSSYNEDNVLQEGSNSGKWKNDESIRR